MVSNTNNSIRIFVRLLNEGTDVSRPTDAVDMGNGLFRILPTSDYDPEDETWEFRPGSMVRGEKKTSRDGEYLIAVAP